MKLVEGKMHIFKGKWITEKAFAELTPVNSYMDVYEMKEQPQWSAYQRVRC